MKFKTGFTMVEMIIVISIIVLLSTLGVISLNRFNADQKLFTSKDGLITNLKLARDYAVSMQLPGNTSESLKYVTVSIDNAGILKATVNDLSNSYYSTSILGDDVIVLNTFPNIKFASYKGNLVGGTGTQIILQSTETGTTAVIGISNFGLVYEK